MNRIVGCDYVHKLSAMGHADTQKITVTDAGNWVRVSMSSSSFPADLTPEEARHIARALNAAARRIENANA